MAMGDIDCVDGDQNQQAPARGRTNPPRSRATMTATTADSPGQPQIEIKATPWKPSPGRLPPATEAFAIGDVHGMDQLLAALLVGIEQHRTCNDAHLVLLGDYVDRGRNPRQVLDIIRRYDRLPQIHRLRGNHEMYMLGSLDGIAVAEDLWALNGAPATLRSFGVPDDADDPIADLKERIDTWELALLRSLEIEFRLGSYAFVHAGWDPDMSADDQTDDMRLTIRRRFTDAATWPHPYTIVHGHTPELPAIHHHRIGVDSGAFATGVLTAVQLRDTQARFIQAIDRSPSFDPRQFRVLL
jgi:serine/threonine protein phosphatase 1